MRDHTDLLNHLATTYGLDSYLEIGVNVKHNNFDHIKCITKIGVDPKVSAGATYQMTSDEYFKSLIRGHIFLDLAFVDGLHEWQQVKKDFDNCLHFLNDKGFIVMHDCNPAKEEWSHFPRDKKGVWNGDCYKFALRLSEYSGIDYCTVNFDHGCTVVWKDATKTGGPKITQEIDWSFLQQNQRLLNLISPQDFEIWFSNK